MDNKEEQTDDSDGEEEEILVFADFRDLLDKEMKQEGNLKLVDIIGIDSENPVIQLNNYFFKGEYEKCLGTQMFFEKDPDPPKLDPVFQEVPKNPLRYICKTRKVLNMRRIFLTEKEGTVKQENVQNVYPELETHASSVEEALDKFQSYMEVNDKEPIVKRGKATLVRRKAERKRHGPQRPSLDNDVE